MGERIVVRRIRPDDPGYGSMESVFWPWMVFGREVRQGQARCWATHKQAIFYAQTGRMLRLSLEERAELRNFQSRHPVVIEFRRAKAAERAKRRSLRK